MWQYLRGVDFPRLAKMLNELETVTDTVEKDGTTLITTVRVLHVMPCGKESGALVETREYFEHFNDRSD